MQKMKELTTQEAFNKAAACCSGAEYCLSEDRDMIVPYVLPSGKAKKAKNPTFEQQFFNSMQNLYSYGKAMQLNPDRMMFTPCLLYTSPSPRD